MQILEPIENDGFIRDEFHHTRARDKFSASRGRDVNKKKKARRRYQIAFEYRRMNRKK